jgi:hypothetical protein
VDIGVIEIDQPPPMRDTPARPARGLISRLEKGRLANAALAFTIERWAPPR